MNEEKSQRSERHDTYMYTHLVCLADLLRRGEGDQRDGRLHFETMRGSCDGREGWGCSIASCVAIVIAIVCNRPVVRCAALLGLVGIRETCRREEEGGRQRDMERKGGRYVFKRERSRTCFDKTTHRKAHILHVDLLVSEAC